MRSALTLGTLISSAFVPLSLLLALGTARPARGGVPGSAPISLASRGGSVQWLIHAERRGAVLTVTQPDGRVVSLRADAGIDPLLSAFDEQGQPRPEGVYQWELRLSPVVPPDVQHQLAAARQADAGGAAAEQSGARLEPGSVVSGAMTLRDGTFIVAGDSEPARRPRRAATAPSGATDAGLAKDQVIADDEIVQGSLCVGLDCVNNETFDFDTIRLKENNTRIKFDDTSSTGFPANDWQLTANDSDSGGANKFSIDDVTGSKTPFTITAGAPTSSLFVDSAGRVGLGTSTPGLHLHLDQSDTPAVRLEQNSGGGFTAQTWDVAGNEANFFVRDVTGGSRLPFRIRPGAPTSAIDISATGAVGMGTASPAAKLHVFGSDGTTKLLVQEASTTAQQREIGEFRNDGGVTVIYKDTTVPERWNFGTFGNGMIINNQANAGVEYTFGNTGNLTISGTLTQNSDRNTKTAIEAVDAGAMLAKVATLQISTWRKRGDTATHLGPMAQDFAATFGLGEDERHIAPLDLAGVGLAAVQALEQQVQKKDARIATLESRLAALEAKVAALDGR